MLEKTILETYNLFVILGANSQEKSSRLWRIEVHEINSNTKVQMFLAQLTKQVTHLIIHA